MKAADRQRVIEALERSAGNQTRAAKLLGVSLRTLINRIDEYGTRGRGSGPPERSRARRGRGALVRHAQRAGRPFPDPAEHRLDVPLRAEGEPPVRERARRAGSLPASACSAACR